MSKALMLRLDKLETATGDDTDIKLFSWPDAEHAHEREAMAAEIRACKTRVWLIVAYADEDSLPSDLPEFVDI